MLLTFASSAAVPLRHPTPSITPLSSRSSLTPSLPLSPPRFSMSSQRADKYIADMYTKSAKAEATPYSVYTVQCTEASGGANTTEATRLSALARQFRLRQASPSMKYKDLYETRRAAIVQAGGSHVREQYAVQFPKAAWASVLGRAEGGRMCSRYFGDGEGEVGEYMYESAERYYKGLKVEGGVYSTLCADGRQRGDAETTRVASLSVSFRAGSMGVREKLRMRYDSRLEGVRMGTGGDYEEKNFLKYPKMAAAGRWGNGSYAAGVGTVADYMGGKLMTVEDQLKGVNLLSYWPGYMIRPAVERKRAPWESSGVKSYAYMSEAAVSYGVKATSKPFVASGYDGWSAGWQPKSSLS
eukprot:GFKZ01002022.1.p1 GENE.GFKZ01002022.1~~GFKZ01002022.1.p1  ORF type:complete len:355 (+),score=40.59 GFKZ01002022.1:188-1252(+)